MNNISTPNGEILYTSLDSLDKEMQSALSELSESCDGYEPYYTDEFDGRTLMFAAFECYDDSTNLTLGGFLSLLLSEENNTAELSALVRPGLRQDGIFSDLFEMAKSYIENNYIELCIIAPVPDDFPIEQFHIIKDELYKEYLFKLEADKYIINKNNFTLDLISDEFSQCEFCFSDDYAQYLMYQNAKSEEPCALCCLDMQESYNNLYSVFVDENLRGKGCGTILMYSFLEDYFNEFVKPLVLNVTSSNTAAVKLYKKCGFTEVSHISYHLLN